MKTILLSQSKVALVDDEDYEWLSQWKWFALKEGNTYYAARAVYLGGGRKYRKCRIIRMHRLILNPPAKMLPDHKDRNGLNNQRSNLRIVTASENGQNQQRHSGTSSGFKGVSWKTSHRKWLAKIGYRMEKICLGYFDNEIEAALAYDKAARKYFGECAYLNFGKQ